MAATHYTQWIFNKIRGTDNANGQLFELRINFGTDDFDYGIANPTDCIYLDNIDIVDFGKTKWQRYDETCALVAASRSMEFRDMYTFSGTVNGSPTGTINLISDKTSFLPFLFKSSGLKCYMWLSQLNPDGSLKEIFFSSVLDSELIDSKVVQMVLPMGTNESKLQTKKYLFLTVGGELQKHTVEELVSGSRTNGIPDGRVAGFVQADMKANPTAGHTLGQRTAGLSAWWLGLCVQNGIDWNTVANTDPSVGTGGVYYRASNKVYRPLYYPTAFTFDDQPFLGFKNPYGVDDGFQGLSYTTLVDKIGAIIGFTFSSSDEDNDFSQYAPSIVEHVGGGDGDQYDIARAAITLTDGLYFNYNVRLGVKPTYLMCGDGTADVFDLGTSQYRNLPQNTIVAATNATPIVCTLLTPIDAPVGATYLFCQCSGALGNTNVNTAVTCTVIDSTHVSLQDFSGANISGNGTYTANSGIIQLGDVNWFAMSTPATWNRTDTLAELMKKICFRFGWLMDFDIHQSGVDKGKPKLIFRNILKSSGTIPSKWQSQTRPTLLSGTTITERQQTIKNVKLKYVGDDSEVYCPTNKGQSFEIEIHGRAKQWGQTVPYRKQNFIVNASLDINSQYQCDLQLDYSGLGHGTADATNFIFGPSAWVIGAHDFFFFLSTNPYNSNFTATDYGELDFTGFYPVTYEEYSGNFSKTWTARLPSADTIHDGVNNTPETFFNTVGSKAKYYANIFLNSLTVEKRSFRTCVDDSGFIRTIRPNLTGSWQDEDGTVTAKLLHTVELDELRGIADCEFTPALPDYTSLTDYTVLIQNPGGGSTGGIVGGVGGSGGTGSGATTDLTPAVIKTPLTNVRNKVQAPQTTNANVSSVLDLEGAFQYGAFGITTANGQNDNVVIYDSFGNAFSVVSSTVPTGAYSITGFKVVSGNPLEGQQLRLWNNTTQVLTIKHETGSSAANQIKAVDGTDQTCIAGGYCEFEYRTNKWNLINVYPDVVADAHDIVDNPSATQTIQPIVNGAVGLSFKKKTGSTAHIVDAVDDSNNLLWDIDNNGATNFWKRVIFDGTTTDLGLDTGASINFGSVDDIFTSQGAGATPKWQPISALASGLSGLYVLLSPTANQTIQAVGGTNVKLILAAKSTDTAGQPILWFKDISGNVVAQITNTGGATFDDTIFIGDGTTYNHLNSQIYVLDIAPYISVIGGVTYILDLNIGTARNVRLQDTSGNINTVYNLAGITGGQDGRELNLMLDPIFQTNANQVVTASQNVNEVTAANRIDYPVNIGFFALSFIYDSKNLQGGGARNRWTILRP